MDLVLGSRVVFYNTKKQTNFGVHCIEPVGCRGSNN